MDGSKNISLSIIFPKPYLAIFNICKSISGELQKKFHFKDEPEYYEKNKSLKLFIKKSQSIIDEYFLMKKTLIAEILLSLLMVAF